MKFYTRTAACCWLTTAILLTGMIASAQLSLPVEIVDTSVTYNRQSTNGMPISSVRGTPPGSDGRGPTVTLQEQKGLTTAAPTTNQFRGVVTFSGVAAPRWPDRLQMGTPPHTGDGVVGVNYGEKARTVQRPTIVDSQGRVTHVLATVRAGAPYVVRRLDLLFGAVIPTPPAKETGALIDIDNPADAAYWLTEPYTTNANHPRDYYWSPHSRKVYAVRAGPIQVVWRRREPTNGTPSDPGNYAYQGGRYYRIMTNQYVVSSTVAPNYKPKKIYWTESAFMNVGKVVSVPAARVSDVQIVYNTEVPPIAASPYDSPADLGVGQLGPEDTSPAEIRTLWFDKIRGGIRAYNVEGRVLIELLGDATGQGNARESLGIEIVQIVRQPSPSSVTTELGERLTAYPVEEMRDDSDLVPEEIMATDGTTWVFRHALPGASRNQLYAIRETVNENDLWVHWLEEGVAGLRWPKLTVRYAVVWPGEASKYSHYVRPVVASEDEASATAVTLPIGNGGFIDWQDILPRTAANEQLGAKKTADQKFYTYLNADHPAHRTLLRYMSKEAVVFERVFSWLNTALEAQQELEATFLPDEFVTGSPFFGSVASGLTNWTALSHLTFPDVAVGPRVVQQTVEVGDRLRAPEGEPGQGPDDTYWAAHLRPDEGTDYDPSAYLDPFAVGFEEARRGAIIPVNARPGRNRLEAWWFRSNGFDTRPGFAAVYWPSIIGRYTIRWPLTPRKIVLSSNHGSGALMSLQAKGTIYYQNSTDQHGYNPNEEHALMLGGQAYALRDDLNVCGAGVDPDLYSSDPFVLLRYTEADGRPAMVPFKVEREDPAMGWTFEYEVEAGSILQGPMPLPLLGRPLAPPIVGEGDRSLNYQVGYLPVVDPPDPDDAFPYLTTLTTGEQHFFRKFQRLSLQRFSPQDGALLETRWFFVFHSNPADRTVLGFVANEDRPPVRIGPSAAAPDPTGTNQLRYTLLGDATRLGLEPGVVVLVLKLGGTDAGQQNVVFAFSATVETNDVSNGTVQVRFDGEITPEMEGASLMIRPIDEGAAFAAGDWRLGSSLHSSLVGDGALRTFYAGFTMQDRKGNLWVYRGPHDDQDPGRFHMQFYYKTLPGFYFPGREQPEVGTITPYLRNEQTPGMRDYGPADAVQGDATDDGLGDGNSLWVTYKPVWPSDAPVLLQGESLALPKRGLPAIRGQSSLEVVYQQSQVRGVNGTSVASVMLHDPTREKEFRLGDPDQSLILDAIPESILAQQYRGKTYFPNLPPHLADRFFLDPNRGNGNEFKTFGALVFKGEFRDEALGEDYFLLNALTGSDLEALKALCLPGDSRKGLWDAAVAGLSTSIDRYVESLARPGTYIVDQDWDPDGDLTRGRQVGAQDLAEILDDDEAVDSYGLSAVGSGSGFVTLIAGNGLAATPREEPVSVMVLRVVDRLYPGELKVIESPNPLAEKVTLQQVTDLAARGTNDFEFQWRIASPVDGLPPLVYQNDRELLLGRGQTWSHLALPLGTDSPADVSTADADRFAPEVRESVETVTEFSFDPSSVERDDQRFTLHLTASTTLVVGNAIVLADVQGVARTGRVVDVPAVDSVTVDLSGASEEVPADFTPTRFYEGTAGSTPKSYVYRYFDTPNDAVYSKLWLSLNLDPQLGAEVYLDGAQVVVANRGDGDTAQGSAPATFNPLPRVYGLSATYLAGGRTSPEDPTKTRHTVVVALYSDSGPGVSQDLDVALEAYRVTDQTDIRTDWLSRPAPDGVRMILGETADVRSLSDNWVIMHYRPRTPADAPWSRWTEPQLVEGYIKRVLKGINPFNQRVKNLFENRVNTDVSILTQAGPRWEGDIALNLDQINNYGLIEIYETVLRRGKMLSIDAGINFPGANDALLLAAGYLNDLYMMVGNEASADAANPTIGIGTKDKTYGDVSTALFSFKGQVSSLLEEELALLRGRDDFLPPGTEVNPVYNRLIWNYTRGIDSGEVIYALNYNILENQDQGVNGVVDADDARRMFPQGHGDAYGHYLTALKGYYSLFLDTDFDWVPRTESVLILGKPVQVDYSDERKFAAAAAAVARAGRQVYDLTWRQNYESGEDAGWQNFEGTRSNTRKALPTTRYWGQDHWASRTMGGAFLNWVMGNAILPDEDPDPEHEGIQRIDRRTVPELRELVNIATDLQVAADNAEAHLSPLGMPASGIAFDINPNQVLGPDPATHFEQLYARAAGALRNAVVAFDDAKDVTRLLRSETDSVAEFQSQVAAQESAYRTKLIELYGTPYPDDLGPGKTYATGYSGEDFLHYMYVDIAERSYPGLGDGYGLQPDQPSRFNYDYLLFPNTTSFGSTGSEEDSVWEEYPWTPDYPWDSWLEEFYGDTGSPLDPEKATDTVEAQNKVVEIVIPSHGFYGKPPEWGSRRETPGRIQAAISEIIKARTRLAAQVTDTDGYRDGVDLAIDRLTDRLKTQKRIQGSQMDVIKARVALNVVMMVDEIFRDAADRSLATMEALTDAGKEATGQLVIAGVAFGSNASATAIAAELPYLAGKTAVDIQSMVSLSIAKALETGVETTDLYTQYNNDKEAFELEVRDEISRIGAEDLWTLHISLHDLNLRLQEFDDAQRALRGLLAEGNRIRDEREAYRQRAAAVIQGFRTRDAAFRIFRNEKLERYKSLFDLSARYALLAANAYDYETGLLDTTQGRGFVHRIISSRALGVVKDGEPQFAGSDTGDPGLSSALAEMKADWDVLKGRLGFNNPDAYGTTVSLRSENFRILPGVDGDDDWKTVLGNARTDNLLRDNDVLRYCLKIQKGGDLPVPGIVIPFSTTITDGLNLFGRQLSAGDHAFGSSSFATKIHAVGVALEGYQGMDAPRANGSAVSFAGGASPTDPSLEFLDPHGLSATPYVYLIPVGLDSMRTPPLGDVDEVRTWSVDDIAIPLPFNIGASDFSSAKLWQSSQSLSEPLFANRKHQSFRPVSSTDAFTLDILGASGSLKPSQFTNNRLIGRSAWNSRWKLVIPGATLLSDPDQGIDRFIQTVKDIKLHFVTYSYSGN